MSAGANRARPRVLVLNPLAAALSHYTRALEETLGGLGADVSVASVPEPSAADGSASRWLFVYLKTLFQHRDLHHDVVIAAWPTLGYWDFPMLRIALGSPVNIVIHDPHPLVNARGYGHTARALAASRFVGGSALVHGDHALAEVLSDTRLPVSLLPHPMTAVAQSTEVRSNHTVVRVLGQYKPTRDLAVLDEVRRRCPDDWTFQILGRGWPDVAGWERRDVFLSEDDFTAAVRTASVVLIPYRRFFQSGIAVRCLENGVPFVGPADSSLCDLVGSGSDWLAAGVEDWPRAVIGAAQTERARVREIAVDVQARTVSAYQDWLNDRRHL